MLIRYLLFNTNINSGGGRKEGRNKSQMPQSCINLKVPQERHQRLLCALILPPPVSLISRSTGKKVQLSIKKKAQILFIFNVES